MDGLSFVKGIIPQIIHLSTRVRGRDFSSGLLSDLLTLTSRQCLRSRWAALGAAPASELLAGVKGIVGYLAGGDPHDADGIADHIYGSAFASRSFGHLARIALLNRDAKRIGIQTETLPGCRGWPLPGARGASPASDFRPLLILRTPDSTESTSARCDMLRFDTPPRRSG